MTVFLTLVMDAYRELNSRKLFWVVLALSALFVIAYASIGFDENGMFMFFGLTHVKSDLLTAGSPMAKLLYRGIFATFIVPIWLAWIATILALVSTAPIFPEFLAAGSIDLVLSKPVSRVKIFAFKYLASLLFVLLQVAVFCTGVFLAMGWRLGDWDWRVFIAVPLVLLVYSYLYSFCVLIGVWTRSTLAALLLTMLLWFSIYSVSAVEGVVVMIRAQVEVRTEQLERQLTNLRAASANSPELASLQSTVDENRRSIDNMNYWLGVVRTVRWPLPKTSETVELLGRSLSREGDINLMDLIQGRVAIGPGGKPQKQTGFDGDERAQDRAIKEAERHSSFFIIGTSLLFELIMLCGATWIFCRRDF